MLDVSTTNFSDVVSNYSSEIPSNSAAAINNAATNQGSYIYTMRSGKHALESYFTQTSPEIAWFDQKRTPTRYGKYQDKSKKNPDRS